MGRDATLQSSLLGLAAAVVVIGIWTMSLKKMIVTYLFGLFGIAGIVLPDWEFFDRDFSEWFTPMPVRRGSGADWTSGAGRFKFHPLRVALLTTIYGFGFYKWWMHISN